MRGCWVRWAAGRGPYVSMRVGEQLVCRWSLQVRAYQPWMDGLCAHCPQRLAESCRLCCVPYILLPTERSGGTGSSRSLASKRLPCLALDIDTMSPDDVPSVVKSKEVREACDTAAVRRYRRTPQTKSAALSWEHEQWPVALSPGIRPHASGLGLYMSARNAFSYSLEGRCPHRGPSRTETHKGTGPFHDCHCQSRASHRDATLTARSFLPVRRAAPGLTGRHVAPGPPSCHFRSCSTSAPGGKRLR
jgi:hypothetical protein